MELLKQALPVDSSVHFANQNLPDAALPNNILAPFWRDLNLNAWRSTLYSVLSNSVPSQWTVFEWAVPHFGTADTVMMQVWVGNNNTPSEGEIYFIYGNMTNPGAGGLSVLKTLMEPTV